jgi:hypothetical protein
MLRRASLTVLFVVLLPATVHAFDHHHHSSGSSGGGGCSPSSSHSSSSSSSSGGVATAPTPAPTAAAPGEKLVFVTSTTYSGALGSLAAADLHCLSSARAAGLTGTYRAWLSDGTSSAAARITGEGPWTTTGGEVAFASKSDLGVAPAADLLSEDGADVLGPGASGPWTGTSADGTPTGQDCDGWTNASADVGGTLGSAKKDDPQWGGGGVTLRCNAKAPLICFEVP